LEAGPSTNIDGTSPVQTIVSQQLTENKAIVRYQNEFDGAVIEFRIAERTPGSNAITMHDAVSVVRERSDELQTPNAALANVGNNQVLSCELEQSQSRTFYSINCSLISFDDASNSLTIGSTRTLKNGSFPTFPESILLARLGVGKALACFQIENWETSGSTSTRKDKMAYRSIAVVGSGLEFGSELLLSSNSPDDLAMAEFDNGKAIVCYSDGGTNNYCRILTVGPGQEVLAGNTVNLGERLGTFSAQPCVVSRLTNNQGLACCEKPTWIPGQSSLECSIMFASGANDLTLSGGSSYGSTTLSVQSAFFQGTAAEKMVHLKDENSGAFGKTEICYQAAGNDQTKLTCDTLQVKESWSWMSWAYVKSLKIKSKDRYQLSDLAGTYTGRFFSMEKLKEHNPADLLVCYRQNAGLGKCQMLAR
jgi:hypothetical protein